MIATDGGRRDLSEFEPREKARKARAASLAKAIDVTFQGRQERQAPASYSMPRVGAAGMLRVSTRDEPLHSPLRAG
jgi:hypothetical protein